jgi:hypothetical protein
VQRIKKAAPLFNGLKVIAIATNSKKHQLIDPELIIKELGEGYDFLLVPQVDNSGEVSAFVDLLDSVASYQSDEHFTFYAHSKGVTSGQHIWGELMWRAGVDHWPDVEKMLTDHPIVGSFRVKTESLCSWFYAGTFFWLRNKDLFQRDYRYLSRDEYGGVEAWPADTFTYEESGCIFYDFGEMKLSQVVGCVGDSMEWQNAVQCFYQWPCPKRRFAL